MRFLRRDDGGLRATCEAIPGFYLSGKDPRAVMRDVGPAIERLMKHNSGIDVEVFPLQPAVYVYKMRERIVADPEAIPEERDYVLEPRAADTVVS